jgi:hypothetical protein
MNLRRTRGFMLATLVCGLVYQAIQTQPGWAEEEDHIIVPGTRIGVVKLGMTEVQVTSSMGKHDGAYSLPKGIKVEYAEWKEQGKASPIIKVFYDQSGKVAQVSCTAPLPATADGITIKSSLADVKGKYKELVLSKCKTKSGSADYYENKKRGIAFKFAAPEDKEMQAIVVHASGKNLILDQDEHP